MRKAGITIVGIIIFLLSAFPAIADSSDDVDVTVQVNTVWHILNYCGNHITFGIGADEYDDGYVYPTGDPSVVKVWSNQSYNVKIEYDCTDGFPSDWQLWTREDNPVPSDHSNSYEIKDTADALYWSSNEPPTNETTYYFWYMIDGFELEDDWVGSHEMTVTYTLTTSI